jgi:hypothetical protein
LGTRADGTRTDATERAEFATLPEANRFVSSVIRIEADLVAAIERTLSAGPNAPLHFSVRDTAGPRHQANREENWRAGVAWPDLHEPTA